MQIDSLLFENFRNYSILNLKFEKKINIFVGDNGKGKTNILEGIYLFSYLKSFRDNSDDELIKWGESYYYLKIDFSDRVYKCFEIGYSNTKKKKLKINHSEVLKKTDFIGKVKSITFLPNDLKMLESPQEKRKFIDSFLSSINPNYLESLLEYNKILKHRNKLLKEQSFSHQEMDVWDKMISEKGKIIQIERNQFFEKYKSYFLQNIRHISNSKDEIEIRYLPNIKEIDSFYEQLKLRRELDKKIGYTSIGIHRDDFFIGSGSKDLNSFASQGQKRSVVLSLKASLFDYTYALLEEKPILLVDDIIRELDIQRRNDFLEFLNTAEQVFFTTTDLEGLQDYIKNFQENIQVFRVQAEGVKQYL